MKSKKVTINLINKNDNKCFQYAATLALNHKKLEKNPERIIKIKPVIDWYNWEGISYPSEKSDWKKLDKNNLTIAENVLDAKKIYILATLQNISKRVRRKLFF